MNQSELYFLTITLSIGLGLGAALSHKHGWVGFFLGFAVSVISLFLILGLWRRIARRK
jgi:predicted MFS family arabinose efflux permease